MGRRLEAGGRILVAGALALGAAILAAPRVVAQGASPQWSAQGGILLKGKIVTMNDQGDVLDGAIYIQNGQIQQILPANATCPAGAFEVDTPGYIYPGLINLHNHMIYNFLPPYPVPQDYDDRDEWPTGSLYAELVNNPKDFVCGADLFGAQSESLKWAKVKELVGGTTSVQGSPTDPGADQILIRSVELGAMGGSDIADRVSAVDQKMVDSIQNFQQRVGGLTAWFFHLAEGKDDHERYEYTNPTYDPNQPVGPANRPGLKDLGMVLPALVGIHCTALTEADFADWEATTGGAKIVWSPLSNLLLYGQTTDVLSALKHHATVCLGTDWTPSGNKNLLWELKVADQYSRQKLGGALTPQQLAWMVTRNPAKVLGWQSLVGMIAPGMVADLLVVDDLGSGDPYRNLVDATESNVGLVLVGGEPLYGDAATMSGLKSASVLETLDDLPGRPKLLDLQRPSLPKGGQSLPTIQQTLATAAAEDPAALAQVLNAGDPTLPDPFKAREAMASYLVQNLSGPIPPELNDPANQPITASDVASYVSLKFPNAQPLPAIDPIFEQTDDAFFAAVHANLHFAGRASVLDLTALDAYRTAAAPTTKPAPSPSPTATTGASGSTVGLGSTAPGSTAAGSTAPGSTAPGSTGGSTGSSGGGGSGGGCVLGARGGDARGLLPLVGLALALVVRRRGTARLARRAA